MGRRKEKRVKAVLPVKVSGKDGDGKPFLAAGHTLEISRSGVRLAGIPSHLLQMGNTFALQYRTGKANYQIKWIDSSAKGAMSGLTALQVGKDLWGVALPTEEPDAFVPPAKPVRRYEKREHERRRHRRFPVAGVAQVAGVRGGESGREARVADISLEGCFLQTPAPAEPNARLQLLIKVQAVEIEAIGVVRVAYPGAGLGIQFTDMSASDAHTWRALIQRLEEESAAASTAS